MGLAKATSHSKPHTDTSFCVPCMVNNILYFSYIKPLTLVVLALVIGLFFWLG